MASHRGSSIPLDQDDPKRYVLDKNGYIPSDNEGESMDVERISGTEIAGDPYKTVEFISKLMKNTDFKLHMLKDLPTFEQVLVGTFILKYHLMRTKQRKYGVFNISKAGIYGLLTRLTDKVERLKNLVGDPVNQLEEVRKINEQLQVAENTGEMLLLAAKLDDIINPGNDTDESIEDTAMDAGNYGDIILMLQADAWGRDMEED